MKLSESAIKLLKERYCHPTEEPNEVYDRAAYAVSRATSDPDFYYKKFKWMMEESDHKIHKLENNWNNNTLYTSLYYNWKYPGNIYPNYYISQSKNCVVCVS